MYDSIYTLDSFIKCALPGYILNDDDFKFAPIIGKILLCVFTLPRGANGSSDGVTVL